MQHLCLLEEGRCIWTRDTTTKAFITIKGEPLESQMTSFLTYSGMLNFFKKVA